MMDPSTEEVVGVDLGCEVPSQQVFGSIGMNNHGYN